MKNEIFYFIDDDYGEVKGIYNRDNAVLTADDLIISNVPTDFSMEMLFDAWASFKRHYQEYGALWLSYDQIPIIEQLY